MDKAQWRAECARRRDALDQRGRDAASRAVADRLIASAVFQRAECLLVYAAMRSEVDPRAAVEAALAAGRTVVFPQVDWDSRRLQTVRLHDLADLVPGRYGVPGLPAGRLEPVAVERLELVLVPGLGFDRRGYRLGYGGGFYDRLLPTLPAGCRRWGLAFAAQVVDELPAEPHDCRLDAVITEREWLEP